MRLFRGKENSESELSSFDVSLFSEYIWYFDLVFAQWMVCVFFSSSLLSDLKGIWEELTHWLYVFLIWPHRIWN
uniref:Uncharacterized protein MANES_03G089900 n=1 Tax=Rhizophora mucronata TaxID=61149 RepID=A0A2P2NIL7_RHIMU